MIKQQNQMLELKPVCLDHCKVDATDFHGLSGRIVIGEPFHLLSVNMFAAKAIPALNPFVTWVHTKGCHGSGLGSHKHEGMEGIVYTIQGEYTHEDSIGDKEPIKAGDVMYLHAGKGINHASHPKRLWEKSSAISLWAFLDSKQRETKPYSVRFNKDQIGSFKDEGVEVKVIAGEYQNVTGPVKTMNQIEYFDVHMDKNSKFTYKMPVNWNLAVYMINGVANYNCEEAMQENDIVVFNQKNEEVLQVETKTRPARFFIAAGKANGEMKQYDWREDTY